MVPVTPAELVQAAYDAQAALLRDVDETASWSPTGCLGWSVRDLTLHCVSDAQRALVALHRPSTGEVDRDAVTYWTDWTPDETAAANGRRYVRVGASMFLLWDQLRDLCLDTAAAVAHAVAHADPAQPVRTQGHVLTVASLASTLAVEATVHHLDLARHLPGAPSPAATGLTEVRRVLDGLLGRAVADGWTDERYALVATGRAEPTELEARDLGDVRGRLPVFS